MAEIIATLLRLRFTILFLVIMLIANLLAGSLGNKLPGHVLASWGIGHDSLISGDIYRLLTGIFLSHDAGMFYRQFIFAALVIGYTEWVRGAGRAAALFFALDVAGTLILLALISATSAVMDLTAMNDVGMSIGGFGLIGLTISQWSGSRLLLAAVLLAIAAKFAIAPDLLADAAHLIALPLGFAVGRFLSPSRSTPI